MAADSFIISCSVVPHDLFESYNIYQECSSAIQQKQEDNDGNPSFPQSNASAGHWTVLSEHNQCFQTHLAVQVENKYYILLKVQKVDLL